MFDRAAEAAKRAYKKISSHTVDIDVGVLAIPVMKQLGYDELSGCQNC